VQELNVHEALGAIIVVTAKLPLLFCLIGKYYWNLDSRICLHSWMLCWCNRNVVEDCL